MACGNMWYNPKLPKWARDVKGGAAALLARQQAASVDSSVCAIGGGAKGESGAGASRDLESFGRDKRSQFRDGKRTVVQTAVGAAHAAREAEKRKRAEKLRRERAAARRRDEEATATAEKNRPRVAAALRAGGGVAAVGWKVRVHWPAEKAWFYGEVTGFDASTGRHRVSYEDGDEREVTLGRGAEKVGFLKAPRGFAAAGTRPRPRKRKRRPRRRRRRRGRARERRNAARRVHRRRRGGYAGRTVFAPQPPIGDEGNPANATPSARGRRGERAGRKRNGIDVRWKRAGGVGEGRGVFSALASAVVCGDVAASMRLQYSRRRRLSGWSLPLPRSRSRPSAFTPSRRRRRSTRSFAPPLPARTRARVVSPCTPPCTPRAAASPSPCTREAGWICAPTRWSAGRRA